MRLALYVLLSLIAMPASAEGWLCFAEKAVGFRYDVATARWEPTTFKTDSKYTIRRPSADDAPWNKHGKWIVSKAGQKSPEAVCKDDVSNEDPISGWLECSMFSSFSFYTTTMTFMRTSHGMFFATAEKVKEAIKDYGGLDTPVMEIGSCTPL